MAASAASNASVIYMLETHGHRLLFTGDVEDSDTNRLAKTSLKDKHVDVFLATHHGSTHGTTEPLFEAITSTNAVLPVRENSYKHPTRHCRLLRRLGRVAMPL